MSGEEGKDRLQIYPVGDAAIGVAFGERIDLQINTRVQALMEHLRQYPLEGMGEVVPAYASLLVHYDPLVVSWDEVRAFMTHAVASLSTQQARLGRLVEIPVKYGGVDGPDLSGLAARHEITEQEVIEIHSQQVYRVYMIGFTPGFAYMGEVDARIATPRLEAPRTVVPAGSVGIAGNQTGIYPMESPGGWQIIGRTDLRLFDPQRTPPSLLEMGDQVRFVPIKTLGGTA